MSEPLKDKVELTTNGLWNGYFKRKDVASAVEWLKDSIVKSNILLTDPLNDMIDEAFADVSDVVKK